MAIDLIIQWEGVGAPSYARRFRTAASINSFAPALRDIAVIGIAPAIERNFAEGGRPKWAPLTEQTIKTKARRGFQSPTRILVASQALMRSATNPGEYHIDTHSIVAEPGPYYWMFHQLGTPKMPQRVIMNLQIADQRRIGGIFNAFIAEHLAKHGLKVYGQMTSVVGGSG
jgi:phage gpG-like protein